MDVDYYIDLNSLLMCPRVYLISSFQPSAVAHNGREFSFCFRADQTVDYSVTGGGGYQHRVWNLSRDVLSVQSWDYSGLITYNTYNVDRRSTGPHHELVLLTPCVTITSRFFVPSDLVPVAPLRRLAPCVGEFNILEFQRLGGRFRSYGRPGEFISNEISVEDDSALAGQARTSTAKFSSAAAKSHLGDRPSRDLITLVEYHRAHQTIQADLLYPVEGSVRTFQFEPESFEPDADPMMVPFCRPLYDGCFCPARARSSDQRFVDGRLNEVAPGELVLTDFMLRCMEEFAALLFPEPGVLRPTSVEEVFNRQRRPTQQRILEFAAEAGGIGAEGPIESFIKVEAYADLNDPRGISTIPGKTKLEYSRFLYAFSEHLLTFSWYAFGKTPLEIANRVATICRTASTVVNTDLSRFDGRVSNVLRHLDQLVMMRAFSTKYHAEMLVLMGNQFQQKGVTRFGVKYDTMMSRLSGSPETAAFNTMANAFMAYLTYRSTRLAGAFIGPREAFARLGIYGGDDGLTADVKPALYMKACASVGQVLEIEEIRLGSFGVTFLSRFYSPDVWFGETSSMCDVRRQISKLHASVALPPSVTPMMKLHEKLTGYYMTDRETPIIGELATRMIELRGKSASNLGIANYFSVHEENEQYPNVGDEWMDAAIAQAMPDFDLDRFRIWMATHHSAEDMLNLPLCHAIPILKQPKVDVVLDGEIIRGKCPGARPVRGKARNKSKP
jgi:hypothetical protein